MIEKFKKSLLVVAVMFGLFAVLTMFFPAISVDLEDVFDVEIAYGTSGFDAAFGLELEFQGETYEFLEFSFLNFMAYLLPIVAIALACIVEKKQDKRFYYAAIGCFALSALLFFLSPTLLQYGEKTFKKVLEDYISLGAGAIIGGISCILAGLCMWSYLVNEGKERGKEVVAQEKNEEKDR